MPGLAPYVRTLAIGQRTTIDARGTTIFLRQATGEIRVTVRSQQIGEGRGGEAYTLRMTQAEKWFHADSFDRIEVENSSGVTNTIELYLGFGDFEKPVPDIVNVTFTLPATATFESLADDGTFGQGNANAVEVLPADETLLYAIVTALSTNADTIRLGDANVDVNQGTPLAAGETIRWESKDALLVCSEGAGVNAVAINAFRSQ